MPRNSALSRSTTSFPCRIAVLTTLANASNASAPPAVFEHCDTLRWITANRNPRSELLFVGSTRGSSRNRSRLPRGVVAAELVQQPLVVRVHQPTRPQMPRHRLPQRADAIFKAHELAAAIVVLMPQLEPLLQQLLQPGTEVACTPRLVSSTSLIERSAWAMHFCCLTASSSLAS